jgi:hypothetical protein
MTPQKAPLQFGLGTLLWFTAVVAAAFYGILNFASIHPLTRLLLIGNLLAITPYFLALLYLMVADNLPRNR